jgi:hypothetical protein
VAGLRVDQLKRQVQTDGKDIHLTPIEYRLLTPPWSATPVGSSASDSY